LGLRFKAIAGQRIYLCVSCLADPQKCPSDFKDLWTEVLLCGEAMGELHNFDDLNEEQKAEALAAFRSGCQ
jgi:hypothetical protein